MSEASPRLSQLLGLDLIEESVNDETAADFYLALLEGAEQMLRGCGLDCIPVLWWATWGPLEKRALADAGDRIRTQQALFVGAATQSPEGAAKVEAKLDGGRSLVRHSLLKLLGLMKNGK